MKKEEISRGSFTVEMAMIMGIVLFVIVAVLVGSRIIYNRAKAICYEYEYAITQRKQEMAGLWGELGEEIESVEIDIIEPVSYLRKTQFIMEM